MRVRSEGVAMGRLGGFTASIEVRAMGYLRTHAFKRVKNYLSVTSILAILCGKRLGGVSPTSPGGLSESVLIMSGKRTNPTMFTALTLGKCFPLS